MLVGGVLGVLGWMVFRGSQVAVADTADGEANGWLAGADDFMNVAYRIGGAIMLGGWEISLAGLNLIKRVEGIKLTRYKDVAGYWTIGVGHKLQPWETMETITEAEAMRLLAQDVASAEAAINRLVKVALTQAQFDALVSFVFNVGSGAFARSTMLARLNAGDYAGAAAQFAKWVYAGGEVSQGLKNRRVAEAAYFIGQGGASA